MRAEASVITGPERRDQPSQATGERPSLPPLVQALLSPRAYAHPADDLELHETHIS